MGGWGLYCLIFIFNLLDVWQTNLIILCGGEELNPLLIPFIKEFGVLAGLLIAKIPLLLILGVVLLLHQIEVRRRKDDNISNK